MTRLIFNTNKRISWIASEIIYYGVYVGPLSDAIEYFIKVGEILLSKNNFGTLFQIINALGKCQSAIKILTLIPFAHLGLPCIIHMKTSWENVSRSKMTTYNELRKVLRFDLVLLNYMFYPLFWDFPVRFVILVKILQRIVSNWLALLGSLAFLAFRY